MKKLFISLLALVLVIAFGILGFMEIMGLGFVSALYATVVTISTTGYGDVVPSNNLGRIFVVILLTGSLGVVAYATSNLVSILVEGEIKNFLGRRGMEKEINKLYNHIIVCGAGRVGENVIRRLLHENRTCVAIEQDEDICRRLQSQGFLIICENATKDEILLQAGIKNAYGLVSALSSDSDNVYVTLTAKSLNPSIRVVARVERPESENKLKHAGADRVISPAVLGGMRMAHSMLKPASVDFVETILHRTNLEIALEEIQISPKSPLVDQAISSSLISGSSGTTIVGIVRGSEFIMSPGGNVVIKADDTLLVLGRLDHFHRIERLAAGIENPLS